MPLIVSSRLVLIILLVTLTGIPLHAVEAQQITAQPGEILANQPTVHFIPNLGQTDPRVRFYAQDGGSNLFFTDDGVVFAIPAISQTPALASSGAANSITPTERANAAIATGITWQLSGIQFENPNKAPIIEGINPLAERTNIMNSSDIQLWHTDIPTYATVVYRNLYNGIDMAYERSAGRLKSTFTIAPGVDPAQIRWRYPSATTTRLTAEGDLHSTIDGAIVAELVEQAPISWQEIGGQRLPVTTNYVLNSDGTIGFQLAAYDRSMPLVIDPTLQFNAFYDLNFAEAIDIAVDSSNNFYVTGQTGAVAFPTTANPYQGTLQGQYDAFIVRYQNSNGAYNRTYSTFIGGPGADGGSSIQTNGSIVYVTGIAASGFPTPASVLGYDKTYNGGLSDIFVIRLDTSIAGASALQYSIYYGGSSDDYGVSIARNGTSALVLGVTKSSGITGMNGYDTSYNGTTDEDFVVLRFTTTGSTLGYASYLGTAARDLPGDIANISGSNTVYVVGSTSGTTWPVMVAYNSVKQGSSDVVYAKINTGTSGNASLLASSYFGGTGGEGLGIGGIVTDVGTDGRVYIAGYTSSLAFPGTTNPTTYDSSYNGGGDVFLAQMNIPTGANGTLLYSTYLGGSGLEEITDIAVEASSRVTLVGRTESSDFSSLNAASMQETFGGGTLADGFVAQFNPINIVTSPSQGLSFKFNIGGNAYDSISGVAVHTNSTIYVAGRTVSTTFGGLVAPYPGTGFAQAISPKPPTVSAYYIKTTDPVQFYNLGCSLGTSDKAAYGRQDNFVILMFGQPYDQLVSGNTTYGTIIYDSSLSFVANAQIDNLVREYGRGYATCVAGGSDTNSTTTVAIGTSNLGSKTTVTHGTQWATLVNSVDGYYTANGYSSRIRAVGASDMELAWNSPTTTRAWVNAYDTANNRPLYNFGDAAGCSSTDSGTTNSNCYSNVSPPWQWTRDDVRFVSRGSTAIGPEGPVPQIYRTDGVMAKQWARIAIYSQAAKTSPMKLGGALTQQGACTQLACDPTLINTPLQGWSQLRIETSLDNRSLQQFIRWSADIRYWP